MTATTMIMDSTPLCGGDDDDDDFGFVGLDIEFLPIDDDCSHKLTTAAITTATIHPPAADLPVTSLPIREDHSSSTQVESNELSQADSESIPADGPKEYTSEANNHKRRFIVITTHFVDDSWKLQSRTLRFVYVPCPHTVEVMCEVLMETFLEWNIDRKLSTLTVDNCTSNDAMISLLLEKFDGEHMWVKGFFHVRCAARIINLIVKDGLDVVKSSIEKVRDSVAYWTATPKRKEQFEEAARQLGIKYDR
ncbi:hypothetical protein Vadar_012410 [Vaccinium darrowii]|uniref:Uncharacterized protein n=1 Tax=Vaccinium darrowii TaxID=229202 RepID=A0ACB7ZJ47_9ERIC|nr:hypothetical protein Vadar_012410 [Vaccinium darrowii]